MSKRIEEILEVIQEVRDNFEIAADGWPIGRLRNLALDAVAARRSIDRTTVSNKYRRELQPDLKGTPDFERHLEAWLVHGSREIANIMRRHAVDDADLRLIDAVFADGVSDATEDGMPEIGELSFPEGKRRLEIHIRRERNRWLIGLAKDLWRREHDGEPPCFVCGFSFAGAYGDIGSGFIEAHHTRAISSIEPDTLVSPQDLVPVCSNCHSILHRYQPWPTVEELRSAVSLNRPRSG